MKGNRENKIRIYFLYFACIVILILITACKHAISITKTGKTQAPSSTSISENSNVSGQDTSGSGFTTTTYQGPSKYIYTPGGVSVVAGEILVESPESFEDYH